MIPSAPRSSTLDFIKAGQNPDGGWGYRPGGTSFVEPSAFCAMALLAGAEREAAGRGLAFLKSCLDAFGVVGVSPGDRAGSWMAYSALLAYQAFGARPEEARLVDWILKFEDASRRFTPADLKTISKTYGYDASIPGWPWTPDTTSWVEPTALFIIALARAGVAPTQARVAAGVRLLIDREVPSGGWNFGNPFSKSHELAATLLATSIALTALASVGYPEDRPAVGSGLRLLDRSLAGEASTVSLSWALIALRSWRSGNRLVPGVAARLDGLREPDGSFRRNPFESALAYFALTDASPIISPLGKSR
jgi:hypothetical protein